ncbi:MAG TPA: hypothetical protein VFZ29_08710 [Solirubrobacterales bacterium]
MSEATTQLNSSDQEQVEARRLHLLATLDKAIAPGRAALALTEVGLTHLDLAVAIEANPRTTATWLEGDLPVVKKNIHKQRIRELKEVTRFIVADGTIALQEADWLRDPHRAAEFVTPLELIGQGRWKEAGRLYGSDVSAKAPSIFQEDRQEQQASRTETSQR